MQAPFLCILLALPTFATFSPVDAELVGTITPHRKGRDEAQPRVSFQRLMEGKEVLRYKGHVAIKPEDVIYISQLGSIGQHRSGYCNLCNPHHIKLEGDLVAEGEQRVDRLYRKIFVSRDTDEK